MNDKEATIVLNETFNKEFELSRFSNFLKELFNGFYPQERSITPHSEYAEKVASIKKMGDYKQNGRSMEILVVKLKKGVSLDRARTLQRNIVAKLLKNFNIDSALVAFISEDYPDWRFSFVKMDYKLTEDGKVSEELTPAKRYSFLVGPNEPNHTCRSQFIGLIKTEQHKPSIDEIENAFGIEKVTKEFFEKYKNLYLDLKDNLDKLVEKDKNLREEFEKRQISTIDFSKKLLGQIVFLYFLQKKGWLGVKRGEQGKFEQWGYGPRNFVKELFERAKQEKKNFFNEYLEPLFYEALSEDRRANDNYYSRFDCKIPFLNGGLFEPLNGYNWGETDILLNNDIFDRILGTFNEFNFTIKEDEPLEKEVAVDPEMLGKVFENLLDISDRKSKGAFYTPREIVHYMCQQSLINYLETNTDISREDLEFFIQKGELALEYFRRQEIGKLKISDKELVLPETISKNAKELDRLLYEIKICDPAVGSGAFPVGMMNEIVKARTILSYILKKHKSDYELKRETIENSLYGVDIEPSASEITKLRFWLSLIVDEEDMNNIKPLPNLENKIMCGNSLIEEFNGIKLYIDPQEIKEKGDKQITLDQSVDKKIKKSEQKLKELRQKQKEFFDVESRLKKQKLREEIDKIEWEFIEETLKEQGDGENMKKLEEYKRNRSKPFFLWKLYFSDVFHRDNPGFDVVIGNPPYISSWNAEKENKGYFVKNFESATGHYDLYVLFMEKSTHLLRQGGISSFITSNKYFSQKYGAGIRNILLRNKILELINFNCNVFETATVETTITLFKKESPLESNRINILDIQFPKDYNFSNKHLMNQSFISELPNKSFRLNLNDKKIKVIKKIELGTIPLENICYIDCGIVPHSEKFNLKKEFFIHSEDKSGGLKKYLEGKDISRNYIPKKTRFFNYQPRKHHRSKFKELFENEKILIKDIGGKSKITSVLDLNHHYTNDTIRICVRLCDLKNLDNSQIRLYTRGKDTSISEAFNIKYLQSIISSNLMGFYFFQLICGGLHVYPNEIRLFPIKKISPEEQKPFIEIIDKILETTKDEDYLKNSDKKAKVKAYEKRIDKMVYDLYELTPEEIKIVEGEKNE